MSALEEYFNPKNLKLAWERLIRVKNNTNVGNWMGMETFSFNLEASIDNLSQKLTGGTFAPHRPQKVYVPKKIGTQRTISILSIADALLYQAVANIIAARSFKNLDEYSAKFVFGSVLHTEVQFGIKIFEKIETPKFYFFQPYWQLYKKFRDSVNDTISDTKINYKFETDITGFFDSISHYSLLDYLSEDWGMEEDVLELVSMCLNIWSGTRESPTPNVGIPQGPISSNYFANLYLHDLDELIVSKGRPYFRYMDDIRVFGFDEYEARKILTQIDDYLKGKALSLNSKKTKITLIEDRVNDPSLKFIEGSPAEETALMQDDTLVEFGAQEQETVTIPVLQLPWQDIVKDLEKSTEWLVMLRDYITKEIESCFKRDNKLRLELKNDALENGNDGKLAKIAYQYEYVYKEIIKRDNNLASDHLVDHWLLLFEKVYWRAHRFTTCLEMYENNIIVKNRVFELLDLPMFKLYEWVRYHLYQLLINQGLSSREKKLLFDSLDNEEWYPRLSLFKLLIFQAQDDEQFSSSVLNKINREKNIYVRRVALYWAKESSNPRWEVTELMESFGS